MFNCGRDADDPLLRAFLDKHHLNLLRWPRDGIELGHAFVQKPDRTVMPCRLSDLFDAPLPDITAQAAAELSPMVTGFSGKVEVQSVLGFLKGIAETLGVTGTGALSAAYAAATRAQVKVRQVTGDMADVGALSRYLGDVDLRPRQTLFQDGDRIFVVVGVRRAKAIEVMASDKDDRHLKVDVQATGLADATAGLRAEDEGSKSVVYLGRIPLVFGVELMEIVPDDGGQATWRLDTLKTPVAVRGKASRPEAADFRYLEKDAAFVDMPAMRPEPEAPGTSRGSP